MTALTVRVEGQDVVASDDEGRTVRLDGRLADSLQEAWRRASPPRGAGQATAAALGAIGEARAMRPREAREAPAWRTPLDGARVALGPLSHDASRPLAEVLARRRSERAWSPPALTDVATVLVRAARVASWAQASDGYVSSHRPAPSAGARHPLDLHFLAGQVDGLVSGTYVFDPVGCELVLADEPPDGLLTELGQIVGAADPPPAAVVAVAHAERTLSRYPGGLSLVWRDAGALLGTLHLCCSDVGLASCLVGSCGVVVNERSPLVVDVGCLLFGARSGQVAP
jgi:SagB-type dehydrogenase family enzyme